MNIEGWSNARMLSFCSNCITNLKSKIDLGFGLRTKRHRARRCHTGRGEEVELRVDPTARDNGGNGGNGGGC